METPFLRAYVQLCSSAPAIAAARTRWAAWPRRFRSRTIRRRTRPRWPRCAPTSCAKCAKGTTARGSRIRRWSTSRSACSTRACPAPNQLDRLREDVPRHRRRCCSSRRRAPAPKPDLRHNIRVGIQYLEAWLGGLGAVPIYNLMEDAATAEISRTQIWQWLQHRATLDDGRPVTRALVDQLIDEEFARIRDEVGADRFDRGRFDEARALFERGGDIRRASGLSHASCVRNTGEEFIVDDSPKA